jgi:hypothetical protein
VCSGLRGEELLPAASSLPSRPHLLPEALCSGGLCALRSGCVCPGLLPGEDLLPAEGSLPSLPHLLPEALCPGGLCSGGLRPGGLHSGCGRHPDPQPGDGSEGSDPDAADADCPQAGDQVVSDWSQPTRVSHPLAGG